MPKVSDEGGVSQVVNKELSPKEINKQRQQLQQGNTSKYSEMHLQQKQFQKSVVPSMVAQYADHGPSGEAMVSAEVSLPPPTAVNEDVQTKQCNSARGNTVQLLTSSAQQSASLSVPAQLGDANQSGPLTQSLLDLPYTPHVQVNILKQCYGPDLHQQNIQPSQMHKGQSTSFAQSPSIIPSSSIPDAFRQNAPTNPISLPHLPSLPTHSTAHIIQTSTTTAISAAMEDKIRSEKEYFIPLSPHKSPPSDSHRLSLASPRFSPKRPSESLSGLALPPPKRLGVPGDGEGAEAQKGFTADVGPIGVVSRPKRQTHTGLGILGAPPADVLVHGPAAQAGTLGAATVALATPKYTADKGASCRFGLSKWDVPPSGKRTGMRPHFSGISRHRISHSTWHRSDGTSQMGYSATMCGSSSKVMTSMNLGTSISRSGMVEQRSN